MEVTRSELLKPDQRQVLVDNSYLIAESGLLRRYHNTSIALNKDFSKTCEELGHDNTIESALVRYQDALIAEAPFAFALDARKADQYSPEDLYDAACVRLIKVDTKTASEIRSSGLAIGLVGNVIDDDPLCFDFTEEDLALAVLRIKVQHRVGLTYVSYEQENELTWLLDAPLES